MTVRFAHLFLFDIAFSNKLETQSNKKTGLRRVIFVLRRERDSNPRTFWVNGFQDRRIRPLCHLSGAKIASGRWLTKNKSNYSLALYIKDHIILFRFMNRRREKDYFMSLAPAAGGAKTKMIVRFAYIFLFDIAFSNILQTQSNKKNRFASGHFCFAEREGFEPSVRIAPYDGLASRCLRPLGHLS